MNKLLELLGFINCSMCGKRIHKRNAVTRRFIDSPKDVYGYPARICIGCDYWCEEHQRG